MDGTLYAAEGDRKNAALSFAAAALGTVADAGAVKVALKLATKVLEGGEEVAVAERAAELRELLPLKLVG